MAKAPLTEQFEKYAKWLSLGEEERQPRSQIAFSKEIGVSQKTLIDWRKKLAAATPEGELEKWLEYVKNRAYAKGAPYKFAELYTMLLKMSGLLTDQSARKASDDINPGQIYRLIQQADAELRNNGNEEMSEKPKILPDELRFHSEQEYRKDN